MASIYLDCNSTTPLLPEVAAAMADCYAKGFANPASQHQQGRRARQRLEQARDTVARVLDAEIGGGSPDRVVFTSGGTEANHLAILGMAAAAEEIQSAPHEAIVSSIEHPSVLGPAELLERRGWRVHRLRVDGRGIISIDRLQELLGPNTRLVSVMLANNETGVIQPISEVAALCQRHGVPVHTDSVQAVGKMSVSFRALGVSALSIAAHKFHGPVGIGALLLRPELTLQPLFVGGFQQAGLRPGTENVALAVGMEAALLAFDNEGPRRIERLKQLQDRWENILATEKLPRVINGKGAPRLPTTSNIGLLGLDRQQVLLALDLAGVCCSTGSACASGSSEPSHVLKAMGLPADVVNSSLRFSWGATTTEAEIDRAATILGEICRRIGKTMS